MRNVGAVRAITLTTLMVERAVAERCPPLALPDDKLAHLRRRGELFVHLARRRLTHLAGLTQARPRRLFRCSLLILGGLLSNLPFDLEHINGEIKP